MGNVYLLIFLTYFTHPSILLPSGNHSFVLSIYESVFVMFVHLFSFLDPT